MRIIVCHNFYQLPGGEDQVFSDEASLLESRGHEVTRLTVHNDEIAPTVGRLELARRTFWNGEAYARVADLVRRQRADVVHFHNTFPLLSPAAYYAARAAGAATVQTLHNYRLMCPNGLLFRDGRPCESCVGDFVAWRGVANGCYRGDRKATAVAAAMFAAHRVARTWLRVVDRYVALSQFARGLFVRGGLPQGRITVKPNFVRPDPGAGCGGGEFALFAGRLEEGKGVGTLLRAWETLSRGGSGPRLKIVGDGPMADAVRAAAAGPAANVEWLGRVPNERVVSLMGQARFLVVPSMYYEGFPKVVAEAMARGTPAVVSATGSLAELVADGRTGLHFRAGDPEALAAAAERVWGDAALCAAMRKEARREFEAKYTPQRNYEMLMNLYRDALDCRHGGVVQRPVEGQSLEACPT